MREPVKELETEGGGVTAATILERIVDGFLEGRAIYGKGKNCRQGQENVE